MALTPGKFPPKGYTEMNPPAPVPFTAVAGEPALKGGDRVEIVGVPEPMPVTIHVGDENLIAIIEDLRDRLDTLENASA